MSSEMTQHTIEALDQLLDREREALLDGDFDLLVCQLDEKKTLIDTLNECGDAGTAPLTELQRKVLRNQALLDSALEGIRTVASRMSALHRIRRSLDTYDEAGRKTTIESLAEGKMEKRA